MQLKRDTTLQGGRYRIIDSLGRGGFGITYVAEHVQMQHKVCIKEFFPKDYYTRDAETTEITPASSSFAKLMDRFKEKFIKEAKTIARLNHPNVIHIHDAFEENGTAYYVMEYIEGESLSDVVKRRGALPEKEAVTYIRQVADALGYIHDRNIMHLDVKPGNIMLREEDHCAILIDFGLSKHYDGQSGEATSTTPVCVSHGYAPMEQYKRGGVSQFSPETDIYSLGATLYCLVTGSTPPEAADVADDGLPKLPSHLSSGVRKAIKHAMADKRKHRPHSIKEFLALLDGDYESGGDDELGGNDESGGNDEGTVIDIDDSAVTPKPKLKLKPEPELESESKPKLEPKPKIRWLLWLLLALIVVGVGVIALTSDASETPAMEQPTTGNHNGYAWVDLGLSVKWASCNVGADSPEDYGAYFAWGETSSKSSYTSDNCKTWKKSIGNIAGNVTYDAARANWGGDWRMPTKAEFEELIKNCTWTWTKQNGKNGYKVTSKKNGNSIFLPAAGCRYGTDTGNVGSYGGYWSSAPHSHAQYAYRLDFLEDYHSTLWRSRYYGQSVRPVLE